MGPVYHVYEHDQCFSSTVHIYLLVSHSRKYCFVGDQPWLWWIIMEGLSPHETQSLPSFLTDQDFFFLLHSAFSDGRSCLSNVHCHLVELLHVAKQLLLDLVPFGQTGCSRVADWINDDYDILKNNLWYFLLLEKPLWPTPETCMDIVLDVKALKQ
jgi:hypothetical protein